MNVIFLGPPGSGKGTQAKKLAGSFGLTHLSTGDVFREAIGNQTPLGQKIKSFVDNGKLVPDDLGSDAVFEKLSANPKLDGFLLDGYPRTVDQCHHLESFSKRTGFQLGAVIFFDVDHEALIKRLSARRQCPSCKEVYNLVTRIPKKGDACDVCGKTIMQRPDDKADVVRDRLDVYDTQTAPVLDFYKSMPFFHRVNAAQDINLVYGEVENALQTKAG